MHAEEPDTGLWLTVRRKVCGALGKVSALFQRGLTQVRMRGVELIMIIGLKAVDDWSQSHGHVSRSCLRVQSCSRAHQNHGLARVSTGGTSPPLPSSKAPLVTRRCLWSALHKNFVLWQDVFARLELHTRLVLCRMQDVCAGGLIAQPFRVVDCTQDIYEGLEDDERVVAMHQAAEVFDPETEHVYKYLQV